MEKIASFTVDHLRLVPGVYVSRVDQVAGNPTNTLEFDALADNVGVHQIIPRLILMTWRRSVPCILQMKLSLSISISSTPLIQSFR